jgi:hypothetical protein
MSAQPPGRRLHVMSSSKEKALFSAPRCKFSIQETQEEGGGRQCHLSPLAQLLRLRAFIAACYIPPLGPAPNHTQFSNLTTLPSQMNVKGISQAPSMRKTRAMYRAATGPSAAVRGMLGSAARCDNRRRCSMVWPAVGGHRACQPALYGRVRHEVLAFTGANLVCKEVNLLHFCQRVGEPVCTLRPVRSLPFRTPELSAENANTLLLGEGAGNPRRHISRRVQERESHHQLARQGR